jgi:hypothetical protein
MIGDNLSVLAAPTKKTLLTCDFCKKEFYRTNSYIKTSAKRGYKHFFCRPTCKNSFVEISKYTGDGLLNLNFIAATLYKRLMGRKNKKNIDVTITRDDILVMWKKQGGRCYYTGEEMSIDGYGSNINNNNGNYSLVTIDRIDSYLGYIPGNVVLCGQWCNIAKHLLPESTFIKNCEKVAAYKGG